LFSRSRFDAVFHFAGEGLIPESVSNPAFSSSRTVAAGIFLELVRLRGIKALVSRPPPLYGVLKLFPSVKKI